MTIRESLESFKPYNEQEKKDAELFKKSTEPYMMNVYKKRIAKRKEFNL